MCNETMRLWFSAVCSLCFNGVCRINEVLLMKREDDYAFPSLTKVSRIKWGSPMSDSNFTQVLNMIAEAAGISKNVLEDDIWFTSHCFRRGGAQYRYMGP
eukprot:jgi/Phyca11/12533/fgenesh1_pm.PHYCAscaffold_581_\